MNSALFCCLLIFIFGFANTDLVIPLLGGNIVIRNNSDGSLTFSTDQNLNLNGNGVGRNTTFTVNGKNGDVSINDTVAVMVNGTSHGINTSLDTSKKSPQSILDSIFGAFKKI
ncbi:unnamed protein product [Caenorhabditis angaria]|uniref:Uncharacterized protein n=1 Tax=Caenorhabditis angaria TaxID=860376 RepID=A0A9P1I5C3_9PELO|nr:unnamed protein product [Caenorhabditis angaria]